MPPLELFARATSRSATPPRCSSTAGSVRRCSSSRLPPAGGRLPAVAAGLDADADHVTRFVPPRRFGAPSTASAAGADGRRPARRRARPYLGSDPEPYVDYVRRAAARGARLRARALDDGGAAHQLPGRGPRAQRGRRQRGQQCELAYRGLLAIAAVGAVVASSPAPSSTAGWPARARRPGGRRGPRGQGAGALGRRGARAGVERAVEAVSVHAFRWGLCAGGGLMMLGGVISLIWIVGPPRDAAPSARGERPFLPAASMPGAPPRGRGRGHELALPLTLRAA